MSQELLHMQPQKSSANPILAALAGVAIGVAWAIIGPLWVAVFLDQDPVHRGEHLPWIANLLLALPIVFAILLGVLSWKGRLRKATLRVLWCGTATAGLVLVVGTALYVWFVA